MRTLIRKTKHHIPELRREWLTRQRLIDLLDGLIEKRLTLVIAPAGYGKSTLLASFVAETDFPVCWLGLDVLDRDPRRFLAHFISGLMETFPSISREIMSTAFPAGQNWLDVDQITTLLVNEIQAHVAEHFLYIVEDLHFVEGSDQVIEFLNNFVQAVGENCHLILTSRYLPSLPGLPAMVAGMDVGGISLDELAFHPEEIQALVQAISSERITLNEAEQLAYETEGWITGLLLSQKGRFRDSAERIRLARVSGVGLYEYLASEVLDQQTEEVREFLLKSALLGDFNAALCEAIFGIAENWDGLIRTVLERNLFLQPVGEATEWFRYHHLFRSFLESVIDREDPAVSRRIRENLALFHVGRQEWDLALAEYERLDDYESCAGLILRASESLSSSGQMLLVHDWLSRLPPGMIEGQPQLLSLQGILSVMIGDLEAGLSMLNRALDQFQTLDDGAGIAQTLSRRMIAFTFQGDYLAVLQDGERAKNLIGRDPGELLIQADILRAEGLALARLDRNQEALDRLAEALKLYEDLNNVDRVAFTLIEIGFVNGNVSRFRQARKNYERSLAHWQATGNLINQATLLNNIGVISHELGDYLTASEYLEQALDCAQRSGYLRAEAMTLASMGDLYGDLDAFEAALDAYHQARSVAYHGDYQSLLLYLDLSEARIAHLKGDRILAGELMSLAEKRLHKNQSGYERGLYHLRAGQFALWEAKIDEAIADVRLAEGFFSSAGRPQELSEVSLVIAEMMAQSGEKTQALFAFENALDHAKEMESSHHLVRHGRLMESVLDLVSSQDSPREGWNKFLTEVKQFDEAVPQLRRRLRKKTTFIQISSAPLRILAFGEPSVIHDERAMGRTDWQTNTARDLLFCLLANPEGMTRDAIGELLWPGSPAKKVRVNFKNTLYRLRLALGSEIVQFEMDRYWFNTRLDYRYDVDEFLAAIDHAERAGESKVRIDHYQRAINLYRGEYLRGVDRLWVPVERERLARAFIRAGEKLAMLYLQQKSFADCLETCRRIQEVDPCQEPSFRLAMNAEAGLGNRAGVVRMYELCLENFDKYLKVSPSDKTQALFNRLVEGEHKEE